MGKVLSRLDVNDLPIDLYEKEKEQTSMEIRSSLSLTFVLLIIQRTTNE